MLDPWKYASMNTSGLSLDPAWKYALMNTSDLSGSGLEIRFDDYFRSVRDPWKYAFMNTSDLCWIFNLGNTLYFSRSELGPWK